MVLLLGIHASVPFKTSSSIQLHQPSPESKPGCEVLKKHFLSLDPDGLPTQSVVDFYPRTYWSHNYHARRESAVLRFEEACGGAGADGGGGGLETV